MKHSQFKRHTFGLFILIGLAPIVLIPLIWFISMRLNTQASSQSFIILMLALSVLASFAIVLFLAYVLADHMAQPVTKLHQVALDLAGGHFGEHHQHFGHDEYGEIFEALEHASSRLQQTLSEDASQMEVIEAERNKLHVVLNSMTDGVFALDRDGRIILFNHAATQLTGRTIEDVAGALAEKVMPFRKNGELVMTRWLDSQLGTDHKRGEWRGLELYRADGLSLFVDVQAITLEADPNGIRALVTFHDLTEEHRLEEMKVDFVALAAHELRTPITEIKGYLDIMQHEPIGLRSSGRELVNRTVVSVGQLSGLVNNLLGVARIEHGELNYHPELTNWNTFVRGSATQMESLVENAQRSIHYKYGTRLPEVMIDPIAMQEVLTNLINNAITHTEEGKGEITITTRLHQHEIETEVRDNGSGIPEEAIKHLFTKFYRYEGLHSTHGTGLGLYICKSILESHGGYIWVESEVGKGARFIFRLPTKTKLAGQRPPRDTTNVTKGAHGWIKDHPVR